MPHASTRRLLALVACLALSLGLLWWGAADAGEVPGVPVASREGTPPAGRGPPPAPPHDLQVSRVEPLRPTAAGGPRPTPERARKAITGGLYGRVLGPGGKPVGRAGITVRHRADRSKGGSSLRMVKTDAEGSYRFERVPPGVVDIEVSALGMLPVKEKAVRVTRWERTRRDFRLRWGAMVAGRVTDPEGRPLAGARVAVRQVRPPGRGRKADEASERLPPGGPNAARVRYANPRMTRAGPDGTFVFHGLEGGAVLVSALPLRQITQLPAWRLLSVQEGEQHRDVQLQVRRGAALHGTVVDGAGRPLPGVSVHFGPPPDRRWSGQGDNDRTDAQGCFHLQGLPWWEGTLHASRSGWGGVTLPVKPAGQDLSVVLADEANVLRLQVVDGATGASVQALRVETKREGSGRVVYLKRASGAYTLPVPYSAREEFALTVGAVGYEPRRFPAARTMQLGADPLRIELWRRER